MINDKLLVGDRVRLTAIREGDEITIASWTSNSELLRLLDARAAYPQSPESVQEHVRRVGESDNGFIFAVRLLDDDSLVGYLEFDGILWNQAVAGMALAIGEPSNWGKGYGSATMRVGLQFAFAELNLRRIQLTVFSYNTRAIAMYERLGFRHEGTFREFVHREGQFFDMYLYGILRREWEANN